MTAKLESLFQWVNSFSVGECRSVQDLTSGVLLFKCMQKIIPDLCAEGESGFDEWSALIHTLTEFCGCSLEYSISRQQLEAGDEEQIARVVVLLLCLAVQRKPNEDVISRITTLDFDTQRDIMYFIEEALAKINSNALSTGNFTSGVGDVVPCLEGRSLSGLGEAEKEEEEEEEEEEEGEIQGEEGVQDGEFALHPQPDSHTESNMHNPAHLPTPHRPTGVNRSNLFVHPASIQRSIHHPPLRGPYYKGLESPAAVLWMQSPALSRSVSRTTREEERSESASLLEEVLKLRHQVRVLERSLQNEQKLSTEFHAELCQREKDYRELEADYQRAQKSVEQVKELADVQDELEAKSCALEKAEKALQRCQREVEELQLYRTRAQELEEKVATLPHIQTENNQLQERLEATLGELLEGRSAVKKLQLALDTAGIAAQSKEREMESLIQQNQECHALARELRQQLEMKKQELMGLEETSTEKERVLTENSHTLSMQLEKAQNQLQLVQGELAEKDEDIRSLRQAAALQKTQLEGQLQQVERELAAKGEELRVFQQAKSDQIGQLEEELREAQRELAAKAGELREAQRELAAKAAELCVFQQAKSDQIGQLEEELREAQSELAAKGEELREAQRELAAKGEEVREAQRDLAAKGEEVREAQRELAAKEGELCVFQQDKNDQIGRLEEELREAQRELAAKGEELRVFQQAKSDQIGQLEEEVREAQSELAAKGEEVREAQSELAAKGEEVREAQRELAAKAEELREAQRELAAKGEEVREVQRELTAKEGELGEAQSELKETEKNLFYMQKSVAEQKSKMEEELRKALAAKEEELHHCQQRATEQMRETEKQVTELYTSLTALKEEHTATQEQLKQLQDRYAMESEEVAAMKASLEEDLSRAQVELLNSRRELREREGEAQAWGKEGERLRSEVGALREKVEWLEKERVELREEGEVFESRLQGQAAKMEEREREWLTEKGELEGKIAKLSQEVEEDARRARERLLVVEREREVERSKMAEEKQTWVAERASLREEVSHLSEELEKATAHGRQLEREEAELRDALREAETSSQALQAKYQSALAEMEKGHQLYSRELQTMQDMNRQLQQQLHEASEEGSCLLQKQTKLYEDLCTLRETKNEMMDLCRQYEKAYNEESERRQALREQMKKMTEQSSSESELAATEASSLRKQLSKEKHATTRLGAENKSLMAQVSFLEQKLRDLERQRSPPPPPPSPRSSRNLRPANPSLPCPLPRPSSPAAVFSHYAPHTTEEEFYSRVHDEFDSSRSIQIPTQAEDTLAFEEDETLTGSESSLRWTSTAIKPRQSQVSLNTSRVSTRLREKEEGGWPTNRARISELKSRNRRVLPHLQSSYAVELQEQPESPSISHDRVRVGRERRTRPETRGPSKLASGVADISFATAPPDILVEDDSRKRSAATRKATGDLSSSGSPLPTRRRISAPMTPQTPSSLSRTEAGFQWQDPRRATMAAGCNLRERLDQPESQEGDENKPGTMFELTFSPPRAKTGLPERLRQRQEKQSAKTKKTLPTAPPSSGRGNRTITQSKRMEPTATQAKSSRAALRSKN